MGIERIVYHSIRCDECKTVLDEYENNLSKFRCNRVVASKIANKNGFVKTKSNSEFIKVFLENIKKK